jgi:hypothetical protein
MMSPPRVVRWGESGGKKKAAVRARKPARAAAVVS